MTDFRPDELLAALASHGVEFVVVGGAGAVLHGSAQVTIDLGIVPDPVRDNLERLSATLSALDARIRTGGVPDGLPFRHDGTSLGQSAIWNLTTKFGDLDILASPDGIGPFGELASRSVRVVVRGLSVAVASLDDIIRSKEAAGRTKDLAALPGLRQLRNERARLAGEQAETRAEDRP